MTPRTLFRLAGVSATSKTGRAILGALKTGHPDALEPLVEIAVQYRAGGGTWTPREWAALTAIERAACVQAGRRLDGERARYLAAQVGYAQRPGGAATLMAEFDGGAAAEAEAIGAALDAVEGETVRRLRGVA